MVSSVEAFRVLSLIPGRMRLRLPGWAGGDGDRIEARLRQVPGVKAAQVNPRTGNILIYFDPRTARPQQLLAALQQLDTRRPGAGGRAEPPGKPAPATPDGVTVARGRGLSTLRWFQVVVRGLLGHA